MADTTVERLFQMDTLDSLCATACHELATVVGAGLLHPILPNPDVLLYWHPRAWESGDVKARVTSRLLPSPLLGPSGRPLMHLQTEVALEIQPQREDSA